MASVARAPARPARRRGEQRIAERHGFEPRQVAVRGTGVVTAYVLASWTLHRRFGIAGVSN